MSRRALNRSIARAAGVKVSRAHKYAANPRVIDNIRFDSEREAKRYGDLKILIKAKEIVDLIVHPRYPIVWPGTENRICFVELDFAYVDKRGVRHYEDVKGCMTALSNLKRKLVEAAHGIKVDIVR